MMSLRNIQNTSKALGKILLVCLTMKTNTINHHSHLFTTHVREACVYRLAVAHRIHKKHSVHIYKNSIAALIQSDQPGRYCIEQGHLIIVNHQ